MTALPIAPADPLAPPRFVLPDATHSNPSRTHAESATAPFFMVADIPRCKRDSPPADFPDLERLFLQPQRCQTAITRVRSAFDEVARRSDLSPVGQSQLLMPTIDAERSAVRKIDVVISDARAILRTLRTSVLAAPSDAIAAQRAAEIRANLALLPTSDRLAELHSALSAASSGDPDALELLTALMTAPAIVRKSLIPTENPRLRELVRGALDPKYPWRCAWFEFALDLASNAQRATSEFLDAKRAGIGAPPAAQS